MCLNTVWKICVPKEKIHALVDELDVDGDGYVSLGELRDILKKYGQVVKRDKRY